MFIEAFLCIVALSVYWVFTFGPKSFYNERPHYQSIHTPPVSEVDYVVVGGGPGGAAAARALLQGDPDATILLVERGSDTQPVGLLAKIAHVLDRGTLLLCAPASVYLPSGFGCRPDLRARHCERLVIHRPLRAEQSACAEEADEKLCRAVSAEVLNAHTPYPKVKGLGGGSLTDWGLHLSSALELQREGVPSIQNGGDNSNSPNKGGSRWWELPVRLSETRNPLSWAFEKSAWERVGNVFKPSPREPMRRDAAYQSLLRVDADGRRLPLLPVLFADIPETSLRRLHVLTGWTVSKLHTETSSDGAAAAQRVTAISCSRQGSTAAHTRVSVRRGVVLSAGVVHTPRILYASSVDRPLLTTPHHNHHALVRDCVALPIMFKTHTGVSADRCNVHDLASWARWVFTQRGPSLQPLVDTLACISLPDLGPDAHMYIVLVPAGGRDAQRYYQMGWDRVLGCFPEALTMLMILSGVEGLEHAVDLRDADATPKHAFHKTLADRGLHTLSPANLIAPPGLKADTQKHIRQAFRTGMRICRDIVQTPPLSHLSNGTEAVDCSVLAKGHHAEKALKLARLLHCPRKKMTRDMQRELVTLMTWASEMAVREDYMEDYIRQHCYWLGFGSGSAEDYVDASDRTKVHSLENVTIGDASACTRQVWDRAGRNTLAAGSVSTAMDFGRIAAERLTAACV